MLIRRMTATFGKLKDRSLELREGLNVLEAPNEAGKSTWCAFLLAMLYGPVPGLERWEPWDGSLMGGTLELEALGRDLVLTRSTSPRGALLGGFRAVDARTGQSVPELDREKCGEVLLGVTREVYERSAFIRQAGLPLRQDADLERRIAALAAAAGEDGVSHLEAVESLKIRRQEDPDGPRSLSDQWAAAQGHVEALERREAALIAEQAAAARWEAGQARRDADGEVVLARERADALRRELEAQGVPETETIARLRAEVIERLLGRTAAKQAETDREEAGWTVETAGDAMLRSPFSGLSPQEAMDQELDLPPEPERPRWLIPAVCGIGLAVGLLTYGIGRALGPGWPALSVLAGLGTALLLGGAAQWVLRQRQASWDAMADRRRRRWEKAKDRYLALLHASEAAEKKAAEAERTIRDAEEGERELLRQIRAFAPETAGLADADARLRECAQRRKELRRAEEAVREASIRRDLLSDGGSAADRPARGRSEIAAELVRVRGELAGERAEAERLAGKLQAVGDLVVLRSNASRSRPREETAALEAELEALRLAAVTVSHANAVLQSRFSPELVRRTSEIFRVLTDKRYDGVSLDRTFQFSANASGEIRSVSDLSTGCADQLYLAARLAICEMVLPAEQGAPLVLDDALADLDDRRCRAAMRFLKEAAKERQVLLFTCHSREAACVSRDKRVHIQRLTDKS